MSLVTLTNVSKAYRLGTVTVTGVSGVTLTLHRNRLTVIAGPSGSGKSTLLNLIGCVDRPDSGGIEIDGIGVGALDDDALSDFRAARIGFIFQTFNLLPVLTAYENVEYPLLLAKMPAAQRKARVTELLSAVGLADKAIHKPGELSGGQRQRVAIARALVRSPQLVLADEPTANLDSRTGEDVIALMRQMQRDYGTSFVISSHDPRILAQADDHAVLWDGRLVPHEGANAEPA
jgi:putative ABC transport system ATP-binding protein